MQRYLLKKALGFRDAEAGAVNAGFWGRMAAAFQRARSGRLKPEPRAELDFSSEETALISRWLAEARGSASPFFKKGAQGGVYLCDAVSPPVVIKAPAREGLRRRLDVFFLRREFRAYRRLRGVPGIPKCHGLLHGSYLVLERIEGTPRDKADLKGRAREQFFEKLFELINEMHRRGVAHGDLQNRNNLLVVDDAYGVHPCVIDFGAAEVREDDGGFTPINSALFRFLSRLDFNTWVKLKYSGRFDLVSAEDRVLYQRTWIEKAARKIKQTLKRSR